eukprot:scaffold90296_cov36-Prasinocladus_malaysianus.AAC.1
MSFASISFVLRTDNPSFSTTVMSSNNGGSRLLAMSSCQPLALCGGWACCMAIGCGSRLRLIPNFSILCDGLIVRNQMSTPKPALRVCAETFNFQLDDQLCI